MLNKCKNLFSVGLLAVIMAWGCTPPNEESSSAEEDSSWENELQPIVTNVSIEYLKGLYSGNSQLITQDLAIEGVITANDAYGEFPTSIIIEDSSGAIEIMCDFDCSTSGFIFGATVRVLCSNLWLGATGGMLSLGSTPDEDNATGLISEDDMPLHLQLCDTPIIIPEPTIVTISSIAANHTLRYVRLSNIRCQSLIATFCTRNDETSLTEYTYHTLQDMDGHTIKLGVDRNVIYADDDIPAGWFSINAIVEYFAGEYMLRITNCDY
ncbi:MAG: DUF5689 domain-containing protein [Rikenellaceae bacterium]